MSIAFVLIYGCLFIKTWRIYEIVKAANVLKVIFEPNYNNKNRE